MSAHQPACNERHCSPPSHTPLFSPEHVRIHSEVKCLTIYFLGGVKEWGGGGVKEWGGGGVKEWGGGGG